MEFGALTIDTCVFQSYSFGFDEGILESLKQFKNSSIKLLMPSFIYGELEKHLWEFVENQNKQCRKARESLIKLKKSGLNTCRNIDEVIQHINESHISRETSKESLKSFLNDCGFEGVEDDNVKILDLYQIYFNCSHPFEATGNKKSEFPDAISLLAIEKWAKQRGIKVLAVSKDAGWAAFAESSMHIDIETDLPTALSTLLGPSAEPYQNAVGRLLRAIESSSAHTGDRDKLEFGVGFELGAQDLMIDFSSDFYVELDDQEVALLSWEFEKGSDGMPEFSIIETSRDEIVVSVDAVLRIELGAVATYSTYDSFDHEYVELMSQHELRQTDQKAAVVIELVGDFEKCLSDETFEEIELADVRSVKLHGDVDWGYIEPDFSEEGDNEMGWMQIGDELQFGERSATIFVYVDEDDAAARRFYRVKTTQKETEASVELMAVWNKGDPIDVDGEGLDDLRRNLIEAAFTDDETTEILEAIARSS